MDLKQKAANAWEAREAREAALETGRQGNVSKERHASEDTVLMSADYACFHYSNHCICKSYYQFVKKTDRTPLIQLLLASAVLYVIILRYRGGGLPEGSWQWGGELAARAALRAHV
jgi:hypothetical protein